MRHLSKHNLLGLLRGLVLITFYLSVSVVHAEGLQAAASSIRSLRDALMVVVPVGATLVLIVVGTLYMKSMIERSSLVNWIVGALIAGSAVPISGFFFDGVG